MVKKSSRKTKNKKTKKRISYRRKKYSTRKNRKQKGGIWWRTSKEKKRQKRYAKQRKESIKKGLKRIKISAGHQTKEGEITKYYKVLKIKKCVRRRKKEGEEDKKYISRVVKVGTKGWSPRNRKRRQKNEVCRCVKTKKPYNTKWCCIPWKEYKKNNYSFGQKCTTGIKKQSSRHNPQYNQYVD